MKMEKNKSKFIDYLTDIILDERRAIIPPLKVESFYRSDKLSTETMSYEEAQRHRYEIRLWMDIFVRHKDRKRVWEHVNHQLKRLIYEYIRVELEEIINMIYGGEWRKATDGIDKLIREEML